MRTRLLVAMTLGALATIASAQSQSATIPTKSEAQRQSLQSPNTVVPYREGGRTPTPQEGTAINSVSKANSAASATKGTDASIGKSNTVPPQAVNGRTMKASPAN